MKQTVNFYDFRRAFEQVRPDNFSRDGLIALFDYLEELENDTGEEMELDVIAICCDFSEYDTAKDAYEELCGDDMVFDREDFQTDAEYEEALEKCALEWLMDNGTCIEVEGGSVICAHH